MDFCEKPKVINMIPRFTLKEKRDMIALNDQFVILIDKVRLLGNEKIKLAKTLEILSVHQHHHTNVDDFRRKQEIYMKQMIESLQYEKKKLNEELQQMQQEMEGNKKRYEEEMGERAKVESDNIIKKNELDKKETDLVIDVLKLEKLNRKLDFLRDAFDEEIMELESMIQNETVTISESSEYSLDMEDIVQKVQAHYDLLAKLDREEARLFHQKMMDDMVRSAKQREQEVRNIKIEIVEVQNIISTYMENLEELQRMEKALNYENENARKEGEENIESAKSEIKLIEYEMLDYEQKLGDKVREYQRLLNLKLALDIEIKFYQKLLEGEEKRININISERKHLSERRWTHKMGQAAENTAVQMTTEVLPVTPVKLVVPTTTPDVSIHHASEDHMVIKVEVHKEKRVTN